MKYDYLGRRVGKQVWEMRGQWSLLSSQVMLYDGWNLIREDTTASGTGKIVDEYIWGLDLSGSLQGAGGVGGLLSRQRSEERYYDGQGKLIICHHPPRNPEQPKTIRINENIWPLHEAHGDTLGACEGPNVTNSIFFYTYDGNGNVSELLNPQSAIENRQFIVAHYEYSPFGETIVATGPEAADNPFRFSTKYWDSESGLYYYVFRYYSPSLGRWLSRDPLMDPGSVPALMIKSQLVKMANSMIVAINRELQDSDVTLEQRQILRFWLSASEWIRNAAVNGDPRLFALFTGNNFYQFCANNSVSFADPLGLSWWSDFLDWLRSKLTPPPPPPSSRPDFPWDPRTNPHPWDTKDQPPTGPSTAAGNTPSSSGVSDQINRGGGIPPSPSGGGGGGGGIPPPPSPPSHDPCLERPPP